MSLLAAPRSRPPPKLHLAHAILSDDRDPQATLPSSVSFKSSTLGQASTQALRTQELTALQNQDSRCASGDSRRQDLIPRTASFSMPSLQAYLAIKKPATMLSAKCPPASTNSTSATANPLPFKKMIDAMLQFRAVEGLGVNNEGEGGDEGEGNDDDYI
ncbi:hypothetical protein C8J57DRAFT_1236049 [Mycena rebaudengoi]|nr:hypothetical protein C8J57DRAFT_1236049 [Mycena rebaudengoi]